MEIWTATRNLRLAAGLGTLGVPLRIERMVDERTGKASVVFNLGIRDTFGTIETKPLKDRYEKGDLEREDPAHRLLDALAGMYNREMILDATEKGRFIRLAKVRGADRAVYVDADSGFPGITGHAAVMRTGDLKLVAALGRTGVPILWVEGQRGSRKWLLPTVWECFGKRVDIGAMVKDFREDTFADTEHPFLYAMGGLKARERVLDAMREERELVLIRKPGSSKSAFVDPDSTNAALDKMRKFFNR